ncbi:MAG: HD domain-containing protein [Fretibacterium sp.]|nr:HD domain-containing protein [Fretibacterium sp.]
MITRTLLERIFEAAFIERWNDHPHPDVFTELGKQGHKMIIAWVLGRSEEDAGQRMDWNALIEGGVFEFLHRVVLTDIRPPVFHRLMQNPVTRQELNDWVSEKLEPDLAALSPRMARRFRNYHSVRERTPGLVRRLLRAAHFMATKWEFSFIEHWSASMYGIDQTAREIAAQMKAIDIPAARAMLLNPDSPLWGFISLVGQLSFQKRWAQTPRVPKTSVLGHLFFVAVVAWLVSHEIGACPKRLYNNFFGGLFHDLPEVLTRDIISPVKASVAGLEETLHHYERQAMEERIYPLLPPHWHEELRRYTEGEFFNKTWQEGQIDPLQLHPEDIPDELNHDCYSPMDGRLIEACDKLAAYIETSISIDTGIRSPALQDGKRHLYERFHRAQINGFPIGSLFEYFR